LGAAVLSATLWHIHLSRVGFRAVLLPLFIAACVWQAAVGWRTGRRRHWLAAGSLYGLTFYTYMAARFTPLALFIFGIYLLKTRRAYLTGQRLAPLAWSGLALLVTLAPLAFFAVAHPDVFFGRTGQVSIWNSEIHGGDFWGTLAKHTARTLGMFFVKGDRIWRHNVPGRPVFDALLGVFFVIGFVRAVRGLRAAAMAFLVIWTATMMLPTLLAEDAPHFLRAVGVLPLVVFFPALGMDWLFTDHTLRFTPPVSRLRLYVIYLALIVVFSLSLVSATIAYFGDYAHADATAYWFEEGAETLAGDVNGFLGIGWDGERMQHGVSDNRNDLGGPPEATPPNARMERKVYIEPLLWDTWTAVPFLVAESPEVHLLPLDRAWPAVGSGPAAIYVWPYGNWKRVWDMLTQPAGIRVIEGARSQGDRDPEPFTTYRAFYVTPVQAVPSALARFQGGVELVGVTARPTDQGIIVELCWHAKADLVEDYTVFVHYLRDGQRIAQDDAQPTGGHYPTSRWQVDDLVSDDHFVDLPDSPEPDRDQIVVGLYLPEDGSYLDLLDHAGNPAGMSVTLPLAEVLQ
jgi:hypothetical protein